MRVVFDTSTLVRLTASRRGLSSLKITTKQGLVIITSDYLLSELERTLNKEFGLTKQHAKATTRAVRKISALVRSDQTFKISRDQTDDSILAAAVTGSAKFLISDDKDLLVLGSIGQCQIINYSQFLDKYTKLLS